jgi:tetratricopeptide (TPR) repeat protein
MDQERFDRAMALVDSGNVEKAITQLHALAERAEDPDEKFAATLKEASCLNSLRRFGEARAAVERARQIMRYEEAKAYADNEEAFALWGERRYEDSLRLYNEVLSAFPRVLKVPEHRELYEMAQAQRGTVLATLGRAEEALPLLEEALTYSIGDEMKGGVYCDLGYCFRIMNQPEKAKSAFEQALRLCTDPTVVLGSRYNLATIYAKEGAFGKALQELEWCEAHLADGDLPRDYVYGSLVKVLRAAGRPAEAEEYLKLISPSRLKSGTLL